MCFQVTPKSDAERFWEKVERPAGDDGCWVWTGRRYRDGYGEFSCGPNRMVAHRWVWQDTNGPIPPGMEVCHRCDHRPCVNPAHLFLGTRLDNERDKIAKGRRPSTRGEENPNARIRPDDVREIRRLVSEGVARGVVAARYGLHLKSVSRIADGRSWPEAGGPLSPPGRRGRPRKAQTP